MKRMMRAAAAAAVLTSGLGSLGCVNTGVSGGSATRDVGHGPIGDRWRNAVDPCYPERYNHAARQAAFAPFAQQAHNGHVLNQTIWNYYFEAGSDVLTPAGMEKLDSLARVRPAPDPKIYIQAAMDIPYSADAAAKIGDMRAEMDVKRASAIQKYLSSVPAVAPVAYEVFVHNPATPGISAEFAGYAYRGSLRGYVGNVSGGGTGVLGTGGSSNLTAAPVGVGAGVGAGGGGIAPR